jgi:hypothetical protein
MNWDGSLYATDVVARGDQDLLSQTLDEFSESAAR